MGTVSHAPMSASKAKAAIVGDRHHVAGGPKATLPVNQALVHDRVMSAVERTSAHSSPAISRTEPRRAFTVLPLEMRYERRQITEPAAQSEVRYRIG